MTTNQAIAIAFPFLTTAVIWATAVVIVKPWRRKKGTPEGPPIRDTEELIREFKVGTVFAGLERPGELFATDKAGRRVQVDTDRALEEAERIIRAVRAREAVTKP